MTRRGRLPPEGPGGSPFLKQIQTSAGFVTATSAPQNQSTPSPTAEVSIKGTVVHAP